MPIDGRNIRVLPKQECCGCSACTNICPVQAINMKEARDGFRYPVVDEDVCIGCKKCIKACPVLTPHFDNRAEPECYAAHGADEIRMKSSSGGIFTLLANYIFAQKGYVCGVRLNDQFEAEHVIIDNAEELARLRGSKYVQSDIGFIYRKIKELLVSGKHVLFTGVPCQVAGLNGFLGKKYDNLLTADVLCHGVPAPGVFRKYINETYGKSKLKDFHFRTKEFGHNCNHCIAVMKNGSRKVGNLYNDPYEKGFHRSLMLRACCSDCKFAPAPRQGDLTLGDFWGIRKYREEYASEKGVSLVLLNSEKGSAVWSAITDQLTFAEPVPYSFTKKHNRFGRKIRVHENRALFFAGNETMSFKKAVSQALGEKFTLKTEIKRIAKRILPDVIVKKLRKWS